MRQLIENITYVDSYWTFLLPSILMAIDILTGVVGAWSRKKLKSSIMRQGLAKKFGELMILIIGQVLFYSMSLPSAIVVGLSFYVVFMELVSICENLQKLDIPIPDFVKNALDNALNNMHEEKKNGK